MKEKKRKLMRTSQNIDLLQLLLVMELIFSNLIFRLRNMFRPTPPPPVRQSRGLIRDIRRKYPFFFRLLLLQLFENNILCCYTFTFMRHLTECKNLKNLISG